MELGNQLGHLMGLKVNGLRLIELTFFADWDIYF
jgi:hypothetical protein